MKKVKKPKMQIIDIEQSVNKLEASIFLYFLLLVLFFVTTVLVGKIARSNGFFVFAGTRTPITSFAGVFSSLSNICVILLVVFFKKKGFITSLILLLPQLPMLIYRIFVNHTYSSVSGLFTNVFTVIAVILLYANNVKVERYQVKLREQAVTDRLTGLPNRYATNELVTGLISRNEHFALVSVDLNNFKSINDTMGHNTGNLLLEMIAKRWEDAAESGLSGTNDIISRQGGDEFTLIVRNYESDKELQNTVEFYANLIEKKLTVEGCDFFITASFGYAEFPKDADNIDSLFSHADAAMYDVKRKNSSNHIRRFTPDLMNNEEHTLETERKIRFALENNNIFFNLQPQYDINHKLRGFEALARMKDSAGNNISPGEFIPVAEKVGLIDKVDVSVFRNAANFFGELIKKTGTDITLSVNVSVRHMMKNDFIEELKDIIKSSGVPANQLEIEITESIMIDSAEKALQCINTIKSMGIKIAIDDFGTGYSSLSYLNKFPADLLKVDKSFIDKMNSSDSSKQYVAAIISIGHIMNFEVISEGVEEDAQLDTLKSIGCDFIQGYIWGKPLPPDIAEELVVSSMQK